MADITSGSFVPTRTETRARSRGARPGGDVAAIDNAPVPIRAEGLELLGEVSGSGYKQAPSLVRRADGQTFQLTRLLYEVLGAIDGSRGYSEIADVVGERVSRSVAGEDIRCLIEQKLRPLGVLRRLDGSQPNVQKLNPLLGLRLRKVVTNREVTRRITAPFAKLFVPALVLPVVIAFAASVHGCCSRKGWRGPRIRRSTSRVSCY